MKYKKLNEVLIEWNESPKEDSDNVFLKSEDIKKSLDRYFVYRLDKKDQIKIFDAGWAEYEKYKNKVWINGKHVELDDYGWTVDEFEPGEYEVYIEDINKLTNTDSMFYRCTHLVSAFIPNSVTEIGEYAFSGCTSLTSVEIPNSVTEIDYRAFSTCTDLMSVTIPNSVTKIDARAFDYCDGLTSVTIGNSVTEIGEMAFLGCKNLKTVYVEDINKFNQIKFKDETTNPGYYRAKLVELKK